MKPLFTLSLGFGVFSLLFAPIVLFCINLSVRIPMERWLNALFSPDPYNAAEILIHASLLPRFILALIAGAGLAVAGAVVQHVLRNPLAEASTLGVSASAQLALALVGWLFPGVWGQSLVAWIGASLALCLVIGINLRRGLSPVSVVTTGLILTLACAMGSAAITLFHHDLLISFFLWGAGYLDRATPEQVIFLALQALPLIGAALLLARPLALLGLGDQTARGLGLSVGSMRFAALALAGALIAAITAQVGIISFVGLAAPAIARALSPSATALASQVFWSAVLGAAILSGTDLLVQLLPTTYRAFPTGAMTALLGAPILIAILPRLSPSGERPETQEAPPRRALRPLLRIGLIGFISLILIALALGTGNASGFSAIVFELRLPRVIGAFAAGGAMALAGAILQRQSGNRLASPEVLGISSGAMLGVIASLFLPGGSVSPFLGGSIGAALAASGLVILARRADFSGPRLLLAGVALGSLAGLVTAVLQTMQDPRLEHLLAILSGSTYGLGLPKALMAFLLLCIALICALALRSWLTLLPLGPMMSRACGLAPGRANLMLLCLSCVCCAGATLVIGPLSFVGLLGPQFARSLGLIRTEYYLIGSSLLGGTIMVGADWIGRWIIYPYQIPAGLMAGLIGAPILLLLLADFQNIIRKRSRKCPQA